MLPHSSRGSIFDTPNRSWNNKWERRYRSAVIRYASRGTAIFLLSKTGRTAVLLVASLGSLALLSLIIVSVSSMLGNDENNRPVPIFTSEEDMIAQQRRDRDNLRRQRDQEEKEAREKARQEQIRTQLELQEERRRARELEEEERRRRERSASDILTAHFDSVKMMDDRLFEEDKTSYKRRNAVRNAFLHAWNGYKNHAFGHDEIRPVSNATNDSWGGFGIIMLDSMDTMLLMGLKGPFQKSREHLKSLVFAKDYDFSFFETTIRILGGLLGAYELSRDPLLLEKADEIGELLFAAFQAPNYIPYSTINLKTGKGRFPSWTMDSAILSEVGSVQLEFKYLAYQTGKRKYYETVDRVVDALSGFDGLQDVPPGLFPVYVNGASKQFTSDTISFGALSDSFYEYLLKQYLLTGGVGGAKVGNPVERYKRYYDKAIASLLQHMTPEHRGYRFVSEYKKRKATGVQDHLACFVPGMLVLGGMKGAKNVDKEAEQLLQTCTRLYREQKTGLAPERVHFKTSYNNPNAPPYDAIATEYILRPETIESLFYMYRRTKKPQYREIAWDIFLSIEKYCKTPAAFSGLTDVTRVDEDGTSPWNNSMQSFFFAETLKYLWLIFSPDEVLDLNKVVLNTEAHPLGVFDAEEWLKTVQ